MLFSLNYLTTMLSVINEFLTTVLIPFLNNSVFEGITIIVIIYLASGSRAAKALNVTAKVIGSAAGSTFLYNYWVKGSSSSPNSADNDETKKDKKEVKKLLVIKVPAVNNLKHSFLFSWILTNLDINVSDSATDITQLAYRVFLLSLIAILCFLNILGYLLAYYLVQKGNYEEKYPKLAGLINY